jgi:hypothetical protein
VASARTLHHLRHAVLPHDVHESSSTVLQMLNIIPASIKLKLSYQRRIQAVGVRQEFQRSQEVVGGDFPQAVHVLEHSNHVERSARRRVAHCSRPPTNTHELLAMSDSLVAVAELHGDVVYPGHVDECEFEFSAPHRRT